MSFYRGETRIAKTRFNLEPAVGWRRFEIPVRCCPAGTDSISPGFGLGDNTSGRVCFADLSVSEEVTELGSAYHPVLLSRFRPFMSFDPGTRWRLDKDKDTWWFVDPEGQPVYSMGTVGPSLPNLDPAVRGKEMATILEHYFFNCLAGWTDLRKWAMVNDALSKENQRPFPLFYVMQSRSLESGFDWLTDSSGDPGPEGHRFPDPFDPRFEKAYRDAVKQTADLVGDKTWFIGWFADNELSHDRLYRRVWSNYCAQELLRFLRKKYNDIGSLNTAWETDFASFDDLMNRKPAPAFPTDPMMADFCVLERHIVQKYIDVTINGIRSVDPDRLIFSNRFMASNIGSYARLLDLYQSYDGIAVNLYPENRSEGLSGSERAFLRMFYDLTGKPIMISEWSVPALDSALYDPFQPAGLDWSWNEVVSDQSRRAAQAARLSLDFYNLPFVVGAHWFTWQDIDTPTRRANRGLMRTDANPWPELMEALRQSHQKILNR